MAKASTRMVQYPLRMQERVRGQLHKAAKLRGLSVNAEIMRRIEDKWQTETYELMQYGRPHIRAMLSAIAKAITIIEERTGHRFTQDAETNRQVRKALAGILDLEVGEAEPDKSLGYEIAEEALAQLRAEREARKEQAQ